MKPWERSQSYTSKIMYAHKQGGTYCHFGATPDGPRKHGNGPIYKVEVGYDPHGSYWGRWDDSQRRYLEVHRRKAKLGLFKAGEIIKVTIDEFPGEIISD